MTVQAHMPSSIGRVLIGLAVLWGIIGLPERGSCVSDADYTRETLRGLPGVVVIVEELKPEVERTGLTKQQLQTDVELRLRQAGIRIFTKDEGLKESVPSLSVVVTAVLLHPMAAAGIRIELGQLVYLVSNNSLTGVSTWSVGGVWCGGINNIYAVRNHVRDYVDQFINAYLSVNPRPAGSAVPSSTSPRRDLIRQVQTRLQAVGFNPGTIDGTMGPQTQQALRWFQNTKGLRATTDLDEPTLNALGVR